MADRQESLDIEANDLLRGLTLVLTVNGGERAGRRIRFWAPLIRLGVRLAGLGNLGLLNTASEGPLMSITDTPAKCSACGWEGRVGQCEPDVDGEGSLGCPGCKAVVVCEGDGEPPPEGPAR